MGAQIREMVLADYDAVVALWKSAPGVDIRPVTDSRDRIERLLACASGLGCSVRSCTWWMSVSAQECLSRTQRRSHHVMASGSRLPVRNG
jgi:hypothetical protein